jgi:ketosteroid isomerase-like protein
MKTVAGMALLLALAGCARHADTGKVADEVRSQALGVVAAYNAQDARKAASYDAPDYVGVYHGSANTIGPAADQAAMKTQMAAASVEWQLGQDKVTVAKAGDIGIFEAPYTFLVEVPRAPVARETGTWIAIFRRQDDGSMKLWRSIASDSPPPIPPTPGNPPRPAKAGQ